MKKFRMFLKKVSKGLKKDFGKESLNLKNIPSIFGDYAAFGLACSVLVIILVVGFIFSAKWIVHFFLPSYFITYLSGYLTLRWAVPQKNTFKKSFNRISVLLLIVSVLIYGLYLWIT